MVRQRHPPSSLSRPTHGTSPVDYTKPSDRLYGSEMDIEALSSIDIGAGAINDGHIDPGGLDGSSAITPGTLPPGPAGPPGPPGPAGSADTVAPPVPVIKGTPTSAYTQGADGTPSLALTVVAGYTPPSPAGLSDLAMYRLQSTRFAQALDPTQPDWTYATQWSVRAATPDGVPDAVGALDVSIVQPGVVASASYWLRVAAGDLSGNWSDYSASVKVETVGDADGPPQPDGVVVQAGMSVIGVRWTPIDADDLEYVEVQWRVSPSGNWLGSRVPGTAFVIVGVTNGVAYDVRLRSVDRSGNTFSGTFDGSGNPISAQVSDPANDEVGWVTGGTVTPTTLPGSALIWDQATINQVFAGKLNADWLAAGSLKVGGAPGQVSAITVVDVAGQPIGIWDANGITLTDPARAAGPGNIPPAYAGNPSYKMTIDESGLFIWDVSVPDTPVALVSITPRGIDAASITFGSARGGHNLVQNSSFELGSFNAAVTTTTPSTWDVSADWTAGVQGSNVNVVVGASALTMVPT